MLMLKESHFIFSLDRSIDHILNTQSWVLGSDCILFPLRSRLILLRLIA
jgi:hypothetical protein